MQRDPDGEESRRLLDAWLNDFARRCSRAPDVLFIKWLLDRLESGRDARIDRYWQLISQLKHVPYDPAHARAFDWIVDALRARASPAA